MLDQILFEGHESYMEFNRKYGDIKNDIHYMPIIQLGKSEDLTKISDYIKNYKIYGFEFTVGTTEKNLIDFKSLREKKVKIWDNPEIYDWYINKGVNIIQTDRPKELINYLKRKKLYY